MSDPKSDSIWRRRALALVALLGAVGLVAGLTYLAGRLGSANSQPPVYPYLWEPTPAPRLPPPLTPFAPADPSIIDALAYNQGVYDVNPLTVLQGVMPVGAYMPLQGSAAFVLPTPTVGPYVPPLPTAAVIEQAPDAGILPTATPDLGPLGGPAPREYGGSNCAPAGMPTGGLLTQRFHAWHSGVDFGVPTGTPALATHSGEVIFAGWSTVGYGNLVILQNGAFITYYAHLSDFNVVTGQQVGSGSVIGWTGSTGNSTGPHIHYEVRINDVPVDPLTFENRGYPTC
jgi:murein DD-endopeptidase MepM/ murein hydrolase activator NlpD